MIPRFAYCLTLEHTLEIGNELVNAYDCDWDGFIRLGLWYQHWTDASFQWEVNHGEKQGLVWTYLAALHFASISPNSRTKILTDPSGTSSWPSSNPGLTATAIWRPLALKARAEILLE
jgi:hypothetical protein